VPTMEAPPRGATERDDMGRERSRPDKPGKPKPAAVPPVATPRKRVQHNVGLDPETSDRVSAAADTFGLDEVQFIRMMIKENLHAYEQRAAAIRAKRPTDLNA
jgi:hypothetical protein